MRNAFDRVMLWVSTVAGALFAIGMLSKQLNVPTSLWEAHSGPMVGVLFVLGIPAQVGLIWRSFRLDNLLKHDEALDLAREYCNLLLVDIYDRCDNAMPATSLGVHAWLVKGWRNKRLVRVVSFKLHKTSETGIKWTKGKGAIGACWRDEIESFFDLQDLRFIATKGQDAFNALSDTVRLGLSWEEFQKTRNYVGVYVWPIKDRTGKFRGCVSVDCTVEKVSGMIKTAAEKPEAQGLAQMVGDALMRRGG